mmetsp:Transcript_8714/g.25095  ORF Transcript_8714/g.25095 Transcript_8714/m.25095 type:complete len:495 (+) Transcript_8714:212-1696(+)
MGEPPAIRAGSRPEHHGRDVVRDGAFLLQPPRPRLGRQRRGGFEGPCGAKGEGHLDGLGIFDELPNSVGTQQQHLAGFHGEARHAGHMRHAHRVRQQITERPRHGQARGVHAAHEHTVRHVVVDADYLAAVAHDAPPLVGVLRLVVPCAHDDLGALGALAPDDAARVAHSGDHRLQCPALEHHDGERCTTQIDAQALLRGLALNGLVNRVEVPRHDLVSRQGFRAAHALEKQPQARTRGPVGDPMAVLAVAVGDADHTEALSLGDEVIVLVRLHRLLALAAHGGDALGSDLPPEPVGVNAGRDHDCLLTKILVDHGGGPPLAFSRSAAEADHAGEAVEDVRRRIHRAARYLQGGGGHSVGGDVAPRHFEAGVLETRGRQRDAVGAGALAQTGARGAHRHQGRHAHGLALPILGAVALVAFAARRGNLLPARADRRQAGAPPPAHAELLATSPHPRARQGFLRTDVDVATSAKSEEPRHLPNALRPIGRVPVQTR